MSPLFQERPHHGTDHLPGIHVAGKCNPHLPAILTGSNPSGLDRLGALERRAGEAAVHTGAQRGPGRNKLEKIDPEMKVLYQRH
ncbi:MAG: hypothetical protein M3Z96_12785 [Pseudomonadota bacterium]|nr:hypothetical protein [Pseudomonadota bacterium]